MSATHPAMWISRWLEGAARSRRGDAAGEWHRPRCGAADDQQAFRELLRLEVPLIRRRRSLPWGTSILAIARSRLA